MASEPGTTPDPLKAERRPAESGKPRSMAQALNRVEFERRLGRSQIQNDDVVEVVAAAEILEISPQVLHERDQITAVAAHLRRGEIRHGTTAVDHGSLTNVAIHGVAVGVHSTLLRVLAREHGGRYVRK